jgi:small GTP-binding protein
LIVPWTIRPYRCPFFQCFTPKSIGDQLDRLHLKKLTPRMGAVPRFKVVLLGNTGVGKTALVDRISNDVFTISHVPTIGAQFISVEMRVEGNQCILELWDTAGQEVFRSLVGFYTREAKGCFLLFDVTKQATYSDLPQWLSFIEENAPSAKIVLFGNKSDLVSAREVPGESAEVFASTNRCVYYEGSAKTAEGVREAFEKMGELVCHAQADEEIPPTIAVTDAGETKTSCC